MSTILGDAQHTYILLFYLCCCEIVSINSRTSTLWKLNADETKIVEATLFHDVSISKSKQDAYGSLKNDPIFNILTSTMYFGQSWIKESVEYYCSNCHKVQTATMSESNNGNKTKLELSKGVTSESNESLDCGKPVNFTYYDNLVGVINRSRHPLVPEPQVALIFYKNKKNFDINVLERRLKKAKRDKPKSVQLYNQIGNFWRIKGDAQKAIECFRRALAVAPHNPDVLLNLARVLFTLQYLDDAIYLTRRSLEVQSPDKGAWQQYFTLGEIFKAYGHYQEASAHLRHTLELKPGFEPAQIALKEMESIPATTIHIYTLVIIICLVLGVLLVILSSVDSIVENEYTEVKTQRHFNKAMAMRSLRGLGISQRNLRIKKIIT